jgi:L-malate glycosyltransferase
LRILFVNYEYPPIGGGGGIVNAWLARELAKRHDVTVLTSRAFDLARREEADGVDIIRSRTFFRKQMSAANIPSLAAFMLSGTWTGRKLVQTRKFDIINTHFAVPTGPVGAILSTVAGVPNVLSVHGGDLYDPSKRSSPHRHAALRWVVRQVVGRAAAVVGQSRNTIENLHRYFAPTLQARLIPLGVPRPADVRSSREDLALPADAFVMITIGRLVDRKKVDQLLRMVNTIKNQKLRLVVVGDGPDLNSLQKQAHELGVADQVVFAGFIPDQQKIDLLAASDIYVSTSQHEGFGLVFLEAMAQGLPVVCYDHGGQTDFLEDGVNGALLPLNDSEGFTKAIVELETDAGKRKAIAARNKSDVERFYIENCATLYESLFYEVTGLTS